MGGLYELLKPALWRIDPERAHRLAVLALRSGILRASPRQAFPQLATRIAGLDFPNPVGLAAGFDKNGEIPSQSLALGFGFVEIGSVTPRPQPGNARPRLFRLIEDEAVINRMGFNSDGHAAVLSRLEARRSNGGIVGVNLGANKDSADRIGDYIAGLEAFRTVASYIAVNVSSPNTPGLRDLQSRSELIALIDRLNDARRRSVSPPLFLKLAPDLSEEDLAAAGETALKGGIDAAIVSNTTLARPPLRSRHVSQSGGLSGRPLFDLSTAKLRFLHRATGGRLPLIGVGGVDSPEAAWAKFEAGASLVQLYTGLVYEGPGLVRRILTGLAREVERRGLASIAEAVGTTSVVMPAKADIQL